MKPMPKPKDYDFIFYPEKEIGKRIKTGKRNRTRDTDKKVKYCPECERCWQWENLYLGNLGQQKEIVYLDEFPSLGKTREFCINCNQSDFMV